MIFLLEKQTPLKKHITETTCHTSKVSFFLWDFLLHWSADDDGGSWGPSKTGELVPIAPLSATQ